MSLASPYDALLLLSFGGPEGPEDVVPFLENVTRGRAIPKERLVEVGAHYFHFGGVSPINGQNRALIAALERDFAGQGLDLPIYWGNRNWDPYVADTLAQMAADGVRRAVVFVTSAYSSYSGCRQYREDLAAAMESGGAGSAGLSLDRIRAYYDHPGFVEPMIRSTVDALGALDASVRDAAELVFVTHSLPLVLAESSLYVEQHRTVAHLVAQGVELATGVSGRVSTLTYCSRSGPPSQPWLEPDIGDHLCERSAQGPAAAVAVPIGFVSDHMEVVYDLDTEAAETAAKLALPFARAATVGTDPQFVAAIRDLVLERAARARGEQPRPKALGSLGVMPDVCRAGCCANPRAHRPALCGSD
ncbi:ferrochelatase [Actinocrinis puniceicyclus]|uniref:Coproporphyrin III ferrochelatase n=1 Tax=Actinocrinis puniceicyclus TaxID=977794 RepID=A0A8J8BER8_9ACTN|nr:ferrochelatase [Actinocrinis puniceicyclus]MBS2964029.1 ferrochelatase [Actinocrinis puniceicyclus]